MAGIINSAYANPQVFPAGSNTGVDTSATPTTTNQAAQTPTPALATPSTYNPTQLPTATQWNVSPDQTVQGQVSNILSANSPIIQQARSNAQQTANSRGLLNSTMAATAGESAAIANAVPIATNDANTFAKAAGYNADTQNQFAVKNADINNTASGFNAQQTQQASQVNAASTNQTNQFNVSQANATQLANIESNYKQLMQTSASASDLYKQTVSAIQAIQLSTDLDANAKQQAVDNQVALLKTGMGVTGAIANLNLGNLITFDNTNTGAGGATDATLKTQQQADPFTNMGWSGIW